MLFYGLIYDEYNIIWNMNLGLLSVRMELSVQEITEPG